MSLLSLSMLVIVIIIFSWDYSWYGQDEEAQEHNEGLVLLAILNVLGLICVPAVVAMVSRVCMPPCYPDEMADVPPCCPYNCFVQLDTVWYVAAGVAVVDSLFITAANIGGVGLFVFGLQIASLVCAIVKLCIMVDCCCQECKPKPPGQGPPAPGYPAAGAVVVGQPVSGAPAPAKEEEEDNSAACT